MNRLCGRREKGEQSGGQNSNLGKRLLEQRLLEGQGLCQFCFFLYLKCEDVPWCAPGSQECLDESLWLRPGQWWWGQTEACGFGA